MSSPTPLFDELFADLARIPTVALYGRVTAVLGLLIECGGL